jgi:hypothetical protein
MEEGDEWTVYRGLGKCGSHEHDRCKALCWAIDMSSMIIEGKHSGVVRLCYPIRERNSGHGGLLPLGGPMRKAHDPGRSFRRARFPCDGNRTAPLTYRRPSGWASKTSSPFEAIPHVPRNTARPKPLCPTCFGTPKTSSPTSVLNTPTSSGSASPATPHRTQTLNPPPPTCIISNAKSTPGRNSS